MAIIEPFRALRYNPALVPDLSRVVSPPYDVIDEALHRALLAEPHNISHLDLNPASTDPNAPDNRYRAAAQLLGRWLDADVLRQDWSPALYLYEQVYDWAGEELTRRGFFCRVRLAPLGHGVHPHERTFSGPKQDRYNLTVATRCNLSQVLGIYPDPDNRVLDAVDEAFRRPPELTATGRDGVLNRVWVEADPERIGAVQDLMAERPLYIADGHHRYETALRYLDAQQQVAPLAPDDPARFTSFVCVGSGDPGVRVMPTHRILSGLRGFDLGAFQHQLPASLACVESVVSPTDPLALERWIAEQPLDAVGVLTRDQVRLIRPRSAAARAQLLPDTAPVLRDLNVTLLHGALLPQIVEPSFGQGTTRYVHLAAEAVEALANGADVAFLLRATPLEKVLEVAGSGELMPQKSTYFYPKLLTGLVMYPLRD